MTDTVTLKNLDVCTFNLPNILGESHEPLLLGPRVLHPGMRLNVSRQYFGELMKKYRGWQRMCDPVTGEVLRRKGGPFRVFQRRILERRHGKARMAAQQVEDQRKEKRALERRLKAAEDRISAHDRQEELIANQNRRIADLEARVTAVKPSEKPEPAATKPSATKPSATKPGR